MRLFRSRSSPSDIPEKGQVQRLEPFRRIEITVEQEWVSTRVSHTGGGSATVTGSEGQTPDGLAPELECPEPAPALDPVPSAPGPPD